MRCRSIELRQSAISDRAHPVDMTPAVVIEIIVGADPHPAAFDARRRVEALAEFGRRAVGEHGHGTRQCDARPGVARGFTEREGASLESSAGTGEGVRIPRRR